MKKIYLISLSICLLNFSYTFGQIEDVNNLDLNFSTSNPDVYSFEKAQLSKVKKYTGNVDINIPIYEINSGNITFPLSISYDAGGIKVDQIASDVGLGWSISKCVITRNIHKGNDFNTVGYKSAAGSGYSFMNSTEQANDLEVRQHFKGSLGYFLNQTLQQPVTVIRTNIDFIPDEYNFYSNEFSTNFFFQNLSTPIEINPKGTKINAVKDRILFDSKMRYLSFPSNTNAKVYDFPTEDFFSISITSNKGIKYVFNDYDLSSGYSEIDSDNRTFHIGNGTAMNLNPCAISAWHISEIEDTMTGKKITFEYDTTHSNPFHDLGSTDSPTNNLQLSRRNASKAYSYFKANADISQSCYYWTQYIGDIHFYDVNVRLDVQKKRLKRIVFDEGTVEYKYNNDGSSSGINNIREDVFNGDFLTKIIVKNVKGDVIKTFEFFYNYFVSDYGIGEFNPDNVNDPKRYKRLKLTGVKELGKPSYTFEYNESSKLPPVNSFAIDFLGYFNNSADVVNIAQIQSIKPNPNLYYYPNKFEKSLLPFPVPNQTYGTISGYFNRQSNNFAKSWSLKKVNYPTSGYSEYFYDLHQFRVFDENIIGGGLRIASQTLNDANGNTKTIQYEYIADDGKSSGSLASFPYFGHPVNKFFSVALDDQGFPAPYPLGISSSGTYVYNTINWKLFDKSNLMKDVTSGAYIGYSKVVEKEVGKGKTETYYTSNDQLEYQNQIHRYHPQSQMSTPNGLTSFASGGVGCMTDFIIANSAMDTDTFNDNGYKRGKLLVEKIYDNANVLLSETTNEYSDVDYANYNFQQPITFPIRTQSANNLGYLLNVQKNYQKKNFYRIKEIKKEYFGIASITNELNFNYNSNGLLTSLKKFETNKIIETKHYYSNDSQLSTEPQISNLISTNLIGVPLKKEVFVNNNKVSEVKSVFAKDATTNNLLLPKFLYSKKGDDINGVLEKNITYDSYDNKGNLLQYTKENGISVSVIWGYNQTLPIAMIENIAYSSINSSLILSAQSNSNSGTEAQLQISLNNLRNSLPTNSMVKTFTYRPLVGISILSDEKRDILYFNYDSYGRLINVRDKNNRIISENEYRYKLQ